MQIEMRPIDAVRPYERNPRRNDPAVAAVAASLREFGFRQPIVVDCQGVIITGHTTHKAARKLGIKQVPVHVATDLTPEQVQAFRLADNKTAEFAKWDEAKLTQEILALAGGRLDLAEYGFEQPGGTDPAETPSGIGGTASDGDDPGANIEILRCTFTASQQNIVKKALDKAVKAGPFGPTGNTNTAGNALARICEAYRED